MGYNSLNYYTQDFKDARRSGFRENSFPSKTISYEAASKAIEEIAQNYELINTITHGMGVIQNWMPQNGEGILITTLTGMRKLGIEIANTREPEKIISAARRLDLPTHEAEELLMSRLVLANLSLTYG